MKTQTQGSTSGLFDEFKKEMGSILDKGVAILETEQSKVNKATFEALTMSQRDKYCQSLQSQGVKPSRIEKITGKSQPTINRHLNNKHS